MKIIWMSVYKSVTLHASCWSGCCADALAQRVADCKARVVLTATAGMRGKKPIQLKQIVDKGLAQAAKLGAEVGQQAVPSAEKVWMVSGCQLAALCSALCSCACSLH